MNRILQFISGDCRCCSELRKVERQLDRVADACATIEAAAVNVLEFWIPSADRMLNPKPDDLECAPGIRLILTIEPNVAAIDDDLPAWTVAELRSIADKLIAAAERIGGAA